MAEVNIGSSVWANLHAAAGFPAGVALRVQSKTETPLYLTDCSVAPEISPVDQPPGWVLNRLSHIDAAPANGASLWAICPGGEAQVFVEPVDGVFSPYPADGGSGASPAPVEPKICLGSTVIPLARGDIGALQDQSVIGAIAVIQADGGELSVTVDGNINPDLTTGFVLGNGQFLTLDTVLSNVRFTPRGSDVNVQVAYFNRA